MGKPVVEMQKLGVQTRWPPEECASPLAHFTLSKTTREEMEFSPVLTVPSVVQVLPSALIVPVNFDSVAPLELPESYREELTFFTQTFMISCPLADGRHRHSIHPGQTRIGDACRCSVRCRN